MANDKPPHIAGPRKATFTGITIKRAADTSALVSNGSDTTPEDVFDGAYAAQDGKDGVVIIEPTYKPATLHGLTTSNNILAQCIEIMEVNVDGTGHTIELIEGATENEAEKKLLESFFDEPYPNRSMIAIRRDLRCDMESSGNGYMEVVRNASDEVLMVNHLPANDMRLVRYDAPVIAPRTLTRSGKEIEVKIRVRERRFVQSINGKKVYFKEFGASRDLDRDTGKWAPDKGRLPLGKRASEVIHFVVTKEPKTPYGVPRWINQLPSVLGSRKAEEFNLDFFDSGGLPPVLVLVQGGYLGDGVKESLQQHLSGSGAKHRAAIVEAVSSSGSLDSSGTVKVTVERFGAERMQDAMFQTYDKNTEDHVRASFRLPPLFTGRAQDYNFATALTGYMTAEAQVFGPERLEFDERMRWIVKALGVKSYTFKSKPMTLTNVDNQLKAIELVLNQKIVDKEGAVTALNTLTGLSLKYDEVIPPADPTVPNIDPITNLPYKSPVQPVHPHDPRLVAASGGKVVPFKPISQGTQPGLPSPVGKEDVEPIVRLANQWSNVLGLAGPCLFTPTEIIAIKGDISALVGTDLKMFTEIMASKNLVQVEDDFPGLAELCGIANQMKD